jgi:hypothetical protein
MGGSCAHEGAWRVKSVSVTTSILPARAAVALARLRGFPRRCGSLDRSSVAKPERAPAIASWYRQGARHRPCACSVPPPSCTHRRPCRPSEHRRSSTNEATLAPNAGFQRWTSKRPTECVRAARPQGACRGCSRITWIPHRTVYHPRGRCFTMRSNSACAWLGIEVSRISLVTPANPFDHCSTLYARSDMLGIATDSRDKRQPLGLVVPSRYGSKKTRRACGQPVRQAQRGR